MFRQDREAGLFVDLLREVAKRDELTVLAWCLMSNHYHLAVRTGAVPLDRPLRSLQQRVTRGVNLRRRVSGPLWQGRYRARLVAENEYSENLLLYTHLNPVAGGFVEDPADHRWSGHRELLGRVRDPITDVDEVLALFGKTRRSARAAYVRRLKEAAGESWSGAAPGHLPWWRLGRPAADGKKDPGLALRKRRDEEDEGLGWRPSLSAEDLLARGAEVLGLTMMALQGRQRTRLVVRARELLAILGVERYGLRVKDLAAGLGQSPDTLTKTIGRAARGRAEDEAYRHRLDEVDKEVAEKSPPLSTNNGGMV